MGFFDKLKEGLLNTRSAIKEKLDDVFSVFKAVDEDLYEELEEALIMADIGANTSFEIIEELKERAKIKKITEADVLKEELKTLIGEILKDSDSSLKLNTKPSVILVVGVNGVGKTTSIGKMASYFMAKGKSVMLAAGDTFRAAASEQLKIWADRNNCPIVKHQEGADPAAVVYDAIASLKAKGADILICDTAGRLHNKKNLMDELNKIYRVIKKELPDSDLETLLVVDATTGQNGVMQAREFTRQTDVTGIILTKLDGTAKGGIVISICKEKNIPVKFIGVGEGKEDFAEFNPTEFCEALF
ncbi:MAG: signal recognition particle-docking protein FtsY [Ruminococcaceae bacterium]|nr:signal recognition particle-docking protein FtsY [Oscillospiraceae bacterium]